jgi:hypothetical protein
MPRLGKYKLSCLAFHCVFKQLPSVDKVRTVHETQDYGAVICTRRSSPTRNAGVRAWPHLRWVSHTEQKRPLRPSFA